MGLLPSDPGPYRLTADTVLREQRRGRRHLELLRETAQAFAEEPDACALATRVAQRACVLVEARCALVVWIEASEPALIATWPAEAAEGLRLDLHDEQTAAGWVMRFGRPCVSSDVPVAPSFAAHLVPTGVACVPILNHQHHVVGLVEVHEAHRGAGLSGEDLALLDALAWQAVVAFERARTIDRMHDWSKSLESLLAFTSIISQHANPEVIVARLVENAAALLKADGGLAGLAVPAADGDGVMMVSEAYWCRGHWQPRPQAWARLEGLPGYLLESEFPYLTNTYADDRFADPRLAHDADLPVARALCTPIKAADETVLGFFELHRVAAAPEFTWQDVAFLESLASMAAITIQNARLMKIVEDKNEHIRALSARYMERLEEERAHIARELHDEAGQSLIGIKLKLQALARGLPSTLEDERDQLDRLRDAVNASTNQLKDLARHLRPPALDHFGLDVVLRQLAQEFQQHTGISVLLDCPKDVTRMEGDLAIFRFAQEAMTNAAKHAAPTTVRLRLRLDDTDVHFSVADDGGGFDPALPTTGLGLLGLRERVALLRGEMSIVSRPGEGTLLALRLPR